MTITTLQPITKDNYSQCLQLEVAKNQKNFVATNAKSLAEAYVFDTMHPYVVMSGEEMVGFLMMEIDYKEGIGFIVRLMIDKDHQRLGYGRATLQKAIELLQNDEGVKIIGTSHRPTNTTMSKLCKSLGFIKWHDIKELDPEIDDVSETYVRLPE